MRDDQSVSSYNINAKYFVVLMITKIRPATVLPKDTITVASNERKSEILRSTSFAIFPEIRLCKKILKKLRKKRKALAAWNKRILQIGENKEQESTIVGLDSIEEQINENGSHFVSEGVLYCSGCGHEYLISCR